MHEVRAKKSLGQHFLTDETALNAIVAAAELSPEDHVLEIGPGTGAMTTILAKEVQRLTAVEVDDRMIPLLTAMLSSYPGARVIHGDFLREKLDIAAPYKVVANLPYYITTPIMEALLTRQPAPASITVLVQKEAALRMIAKPGGKDYGPLSLRVALWGKAAISLELGPEAFNPPPKVDSALVHIAPDPTPGAEAAMAVANVAFLQRRKQLGNALGGLGRPKDAVHVALACCGIDSSRRPETLTPQEYVALGKALGL